jgi:hypothetical protein
MGSGASTQCPLLLDLVVVVVVEIECNEVVTLDVMCAVVDVRSDESVDVVVDDGIRVVQPCPEHFEIVMSAQFQNFSAPLLLVLGSTTAGEHAGNKGFHHVLASPPNLELIQDCVSLLPKYSANPAGLQELAVTQNH